MPASRYVTITPTVPGGPGVMFCLSDDSQLSRWGLGSTGEGGWQIVDRPRQGATTEWVDYSPSELTLNLILDGYGDGSQAPQSVEAACAATASWELPADGSSPPEPAKLAVSGPVPVSPSQLWVVYILSWGNAVRDPSTGLRTYQELQLTLFEYKPPVVTVTQASPAAVARALTGLPATTPTGGTTPLSSTSSYTVKTGDTLLTIAATQLGDANDWVLIAQLNRIRDPRAISVGQVLKLPYVPGKTKRPSKNIVAPNPYTIRNKRGQVVGYGEVPGPTFGNIALAQGVGAAGADVVGG